MIFHPLTWVLMMAAGLGTLLYGLAAWRMLSIVAHWQPDCADRAQLKCERQAETASLLGRWAVGVLTAAGVIQLIGIALIWPAMVAGAMCGTGVLQAMGPSGAQALGWWAAGLIVLHGWRVMDRLNLARPWGELTADNGRVLLLAAPLIAMALMHSILALMHAETAAPVSCCAAIYDQIIHAPQSPRTQQALQIIQLGLYWTGAAALLGLAQWQRRFAGSQAVMGLLGICLIWTLAATGTLKCIWSAYYYEVLSHSCLWCLFSMDYYGAGFILTLALAAVLVNAVAMVLIWRAWGIWPALGPAAAAGIRRHAMFLTIAISVYLAAASGPALMWRLKNGMWLTGH